MAEGKRESSRDQKGKGKAPRDHPGPQRKSPTTNLGQKEKRKRPAHTHFDPIPLGNQTARTHARTKRNDFPVEHPPTSDFVVELMVCFDGEVTDHLRLNVLVKHN